jgi:large subunit ribosomal protein L19
MFPSIFQKALPSTTKSIAPRAMKWRYQSAQSLSTATGVSPEEMPFHHFRNHRNPSNSTHKKFISPRKRANIMMTEITQDAKEERHNPKVHDVKFRVGDAIEMTMISQGGANSNATEKIRGVVLGMDKRGLGTGIYLRDVVFGEPIDRKIPLYSPLLKNITVLEENFVFKKKRKVKRAKLYYLRDRLPQETRVTKY